MTARFDPDGAETQRSTEPFPLVIVDGAFDEDTLAAVLDEWPRLDDPRWINYRANQEYRKLEGSDDTLWSAAAVDVVAAMGAVDTIEWVAEQLQLPDTGLTALTVGGGYHTTIGGGYLAPHVDFNGHPVDGRWRRVNVLLFLVRDYDPEWGGCLRLGEPGSATERVVEPRFGRLVAFETSSTSWHGHPDPWLGPEPRRSLAAYYFSPEQVPATVTKHSTRWYAEEGARLEIEALHDAVSQAERAADAARGSSEAAEARAAASDRQAAVSDQLVASLEVRLADIEHSTSWRITAPLRRASDKLRALRRH